TRQDNFSKEFIPAETIIFFHYERKNSPSGGFHALAPTPGRAIAFAAGTPRSFGQGDGGLNRHVRGHPAQPRARGKGRGHRGVSGGNDGAGHRTRSGGTGGSGLSGGSG